MFTVRFEFLKHIVRFTFIILFKLKVVYDTKQGVRVYDYFYYYHHYKTRRVNMMKRGKDHAV